MIFTRRKFLIGLAAPAIIKVAGIMPVRRPPLVTRATEDTLVALLITPTSHNAGSVKIRDEAGSAIPVFNGGPVPSLIPFYIPLGLAGNWTVETEGDVQALAIGSFL